MNRLGPEIAVIMPVFNAGDRLAGVLERLLRVVENVVVVNDGSTDGCIENARNLPVTLVEFDENRGKGHALKAGYARALEDARVQCVGVIDADGQHNPEELPALYAAMRSSDADLVIGARDFSGDGVPWRSRFGNRMTIALTRTLFGTAVRDTQSGYRLASRRFLEAVLPALPGGRYETEMELLGRALRMKCNVASVPIQTLYEPGNPSSHFNKWRDSYLIYKKLFGTALGKGGPTT